MKRDVGSCPHCLPSSGWRKSYRQLHTQQESVQRETVLICRYIKGCPSQNPSGRHLWLIHSATALPFTSPEDEIPARAAVQLCQPCFCSGCNPAPQCLCCAGTGNCFGISQMAEMLVFPNGSSAAGGMEGSSLFLDSV